MQDLAVQGKLRVPRLLDRVDHAERMQMLDDSGVRAPFRSNDYEYQLFLKLIPKHFLLLKKNWKISHFLFKFFIQKILKLQHLQICVFLFFSFSLFTSLSLFSFISVLISLHSHLSLFSSLSRLNSILLFSFSLLCFTSLSHLISVSLLNDNDSDHWFSKLSICTLIARVHGPWPFRCLARSSLDATVQVYLRTTRAT